jgi:hypothetical protein
MKRVFGDVAAALASIQIHLFESGTIQFRGGVMIGESNMDIVGEI